ncbi:MAG: nitroreductase family protein [Bacteroidetes bacterium]|nr:nitroreductase family protein [Bacteroidota bacterium]
MITPTITSLLNAKAFESLVQSRRSVRKFDRSVSVPEEAIHRSLQCALLSPNSSNMQLWHFTWVKSPEVRARMVPLCLGQNAAKTASHLVVFQTRIDLWRRHARWNLEQTPPSSGSESDKRRMQLMRKYYSVLMPLAYRTDPFGLNTLVRKLGSFLLGLTRPVMRLGGRGWQRVLLHKSCGLAAQTFMLAMQAEGYDTCPMEGFDAVRVKKLLGLPAGSEICMIVAVGKGTPAGVYGDRKRLPLEDVVSIV